MGRIAGTTADETRGRLLDAAALVFQRKGYEGATVSLIAAEAGVTSGAIYAHWAGKAELLAAALDAHRGRAIGALLPQAGTADARSVLLALGEHIRQRDADDVGLLLEAVVASRRDPELAEVLARAVAEHERGAGDLVELAQAAGDLVDDVSGAAAARLLLLLGIGSAVLSSLDLPAPPQDEWSQLIQRLVGAFTPEGPTP